MNDAPEKKTQIDLSSVASNEEIRAYLKNSIVEESVSRVVKGFRNYFYLQRIIEAVAVFLVACFGLLSISTYYDVVGDLREDNKELLSGVDDRISYGIKKAIKGQTVELERVKNQSREAIITQKVAIQRFEDRAKSQRDRVEAAQKSLDDLLQSKEWRETNFLKYVEKLYGDSKRKDTVIGIQKRIEALEKRTTVIAWGTLIPPEEKGGKMRGHDSGVANTTRIGPGKYRITLDSEFSLTSDYTVVATAQHGTFATCYVETQDTGHFTIVTSYQNANGKISNDDRAFNYAVFGQASPGN